MDSSLRTFLPGGEVARRKCLHGRVESILAQGRYFALASWIINSRSQQSRTTVAYSAVINGAVLSTAKFVTMYL
jgi:hypothetical protein